MSGYSGCNWDHGFQPTTGFIFLPSETGIQVTNIWNMWMGWNRPPVMTRGMDISYGRMISWSFLKMVAADPISISSSPIHHSIVLGATIAWPIPDWTPSPGCQHLPPSGLVPWQQQQQRPCDQWCCCPVHRGSSRGGAKSQDHSASVRRRVSSRRGWEGMGGGQKTGDFCIAVFAVFAEKTQVDFGLPGLVAKGELVVPEFYYRLPWAFGFRTTQESTSSVMAGNWMVPNNWPIPENILYTSFKRTNLEAIRCGSMLQAFLMRLVEIGWESRISGTQRSDFESGNQSDEAWNVCGWLWLGRQTDWKDAWIIMNFKFKLLLTYPGIVQYTIFSHNCFSNPIKFQFF